MTLQEQERCSLSPRHQHPREKAKQTSLPLRGLCGEDTEGCMWPLASGSQASVSRPRFSGFEEARQERVLKDAQGPLPPPLPLPPPQPPPPSQAAAQGHLQLWTCICCAHGNAIQWNAMEMANCRCLIPSVEWMSDPSVPDLPCAWRASVSLRRPLFPP